MTPNHIAINGSRLFYTECNAANKPLIFFFHGNSSSHATWKTAMESKLLSQFRLVAFDLPAHGFSEGMPDGPGSYTLPAIAAVMAAAVKQIAAGYPFLLAGVSLGTNIIAEMLAHGLGPAGLLLAGPCIIGEGYGLDKVVIPGTKIGVGFMDELEDEDIFALIDLAANDPDAEARQLIYHDFKAVKDRFRSRMGQSIGERLYSDEVELLTQQNSPVLVIFGEADRAVCTDYLDNAPIPLWNNKIIHLKGAGHWVHLDAPLVFTQLMAEFAVGIFSKAGS